MSDLDGRVARLEYWRDGNGAHGAEQRLQATEALTAEQGDDIREIKHDVAEILKKIGGRRDAWRFFLQVFPAWIPVIAFILGLLWAKTNLLPLLLGG